MLIKRLIQITLILAVLVSSLAFTHGVSANASCGSTYVVQPGDWLSKIAGRCGITLSALIAANPWVSYYYYIYPGQVLNIPGGYLWRACAGRQRLLPAQLRPHLQRLLWQLLRGLLRRHTARDRKLLRERTCRTSSGITASATPT